MDKKLVSIVQYEVPTDRSSLNPFSTSRDPHQSSFRWVMLILLRLSFIIRFIRIFSINFHLTFTQKPL